MKILKTGLGAALLTVALAAIAATPFGQQFGAYLKQKYYPYMSPPQAPTPADKNNPPGFQITAQVGRTLAQGIAATASSIDSQIGAFANYDVYTKDVTTDMIVNNVVSSCKTGSGGKTYACDFTKGMAGNTILVNSLMAVSAYADDASRKAAFNFITNMTNMQPINFPGESKVFKDPSDPSKGLSDDGVKYFGLAFKQLPSLSVARFSLLHLFSERERLPGMAGDLPIGTGGAASILEVLEYEAARRYMNPGWFNQMGSATDPAVQREIAYMLAFQNFMLVKSYEQNERMEALLVAQINALNNLSNQGASQMTPAAQQKSQQNLDSRT